MIGVDGPFMYLQVFGGSNKYPLHKLGAPWQMRVSSPLLHRLCKSLGKAHGTLSYHEEYLVFSWSNVYVGLVGHIFDDSIP
jgi:hypothetical protein